MPDPGAMAASATGEQLAGLPLLGQAAVTLVVTAVPAAGELVGLLVEPAEPDPTRVFRRTGQPMRIRWSASTRIVMGSSADLVPGALLRVRGLRRAADEIQAALIAVLTGNAELLDPA
jgi:hypothetical protein